MSLFAGRRQFTEDDLRRWAKQGLITDAQVEAILKAEAPAAAAREGETREGLNAPTILYYMGTSMALVALGVFAGINWQDAAKGLRLVLMLGSMALLAAAGYLVRRYTPYQRGGGALFTMAVGTIPFLFFTLGDFVAGPERDAIFNEEMLGQATLIQSISLACMLAILLASGIGMVSLAVTGQAVALTATASIWWLGTDEGVGVLSILVALGAVLIAVGLATRAVSLSEHALWFGLSGLVVFFYSYTAVTMMEWNGFLAVVYLLTFAGMALLSTVLRYLPFLVAGVLGVYIFIFRLIFDTFEGSPFLPLAIAVVGISMIALAIGYQRYRGRLPLRPA